MQLRLMARKNGSASFAPELNVWTRWRCRRCFSNIPASLQGTHKKAVFEKNNGWYSGSSSLSGEERKLGDQEEVLEKLRVQYWSCSVSSKDGAKARRRMESRREEEVVWKEDCKMEVEEETDCRTKFDVRKKHLQRQLRDIEKFHRHGSSFPGQAERKLEGRVARDCEEGDRTSAGAAQDAEVSEAAELAGQEEEPPQGRG